jgi:CRP/FNR family transcriptional regulator, nitrogen fixation regulation protein
LAAVTNYTPLLRFFMLSSNQARSTNQKRDELIKTVDAIGTRKRCGRRQEICHGDERTRSWYRLVSGAARRYSILPDGRRQITALFLPGDFIGCYLTGQGEGSVIEAINDGTIIVEYAASRIEALAAGDLIVARELFEVAFQAISKLEEQVLTIARGKAAEKVALFVLHLAEHPSIANAPIITLPLTRYDIADYLAVSPETVCRCFTDLKNRGVIRLPTRRQIAIVNRGALENRAYQGGLPG